jgi:predicted HicB family RNase H-like nuclease
MSEFLEYKGYSGSVRFSADDEVFHGKLEGIRDLVTYEGTDVISLKRNFEDAVEDYLQTCQKKNREPQAPYKGSFNVRVGPDLHKRAAAFAVEHHKKLNTIVTEALEHYLETANC